MKIEYDLHIHTHFSDGSYSPDEIIEKVKTGSTTATDKKCSKENILKGISITDHDNCDAYPINQNSIELITGIELSTKACGSDIEILGYFIDVNNHDLVKVVNSAIEVRRNRIKNILNELEKKEIYISIEEVQKHSFGRALVRPHIARVMIEKGIVDDVQSAFVKYLKDKKISSFSKNFYSPEDIIEIIHSSGGIAILAHPVFYNKKCSLKKLIDFLISKGLDGVELYYPYGNINLDFEKFKNYVLEKRINGKQLLYSGGSDFHGSSKKNINLGMCGIDYDSFMRLKEKSYEYA